MSETNRTPPANIVWFEIPADDLGRAKKFYGELFGWKITPFPNMPTYSEIDTGGPDASPNGGLMERKHPAHTITNYIMVPSVTEYMAKIEKLGGSICMPKTAVPHMGYFAVGKDTENNSFGIWEMDPSAQ